MESGILYIVATPIGNLQDFSPRAISTLEQVDLILCEDTRHSAPLLQNFGIKAKTMAYHEHNERDVCDKIISMLQAGQNLAIISDAGTPLINDPGYVLVSMCHQHNIKVQPIPGCCAFVTALSASGIGTDKFSYFGFLPAKSGARCEFLAKIYHNQETSIFYESTHRIVDTLKDIIATLGAERQVCLARELTKQFETIVTASAQEVFEYLEVCPNHQKGEFVIIIDKGPEQTASLTPQLSCLIKDLKDDLPPKVLAKKIANAYKLDKKELYNYIISLEK